MSLIEEKFAAIDALEKTEVFAKQELLIKILRYLVTQEKEGKTPKSTTIALEVLDHSQEIYNAQDSFIRAQIFSLRKKLELYYLTEGKKIKERLSIPKGTYKVKLTILEQSKNKLTLKGKKIIYAGVAALTLSVFFNVISFKKLHERPPKPILPEIFQTIYESTSSLKIAISELYFYREYDPELGRYRYILDTKRELPSELNRMVHFIKKYPERKISMTNRSYIDPSMWSFGLKLQNSFETLGKTSEILRSFHVKKTNNHDILFLGSFGEGSMGELKNYFDMSSFRFNSSEVGVITTSIISQKDTLHYHWQRVKHNKNRKAYFLIFKCLDIQGNQLLFLLSGDIMSRNYMQSILYTPTFTEELKKQFGGELPQQYEAMIEVGGKELLGTKHKIIHAKKIN